MREISEADKQAIKKFVREVLGCTCPDEVFANVSFEKNPSKLAEISQGDLVSIGDKLLVYLTSTNDGELLAGKLEQILHQGRELRNIRNFNRFRLVVSCENEQAIRDRLNQKLKNMDNIDERLHLHVIGSDQLPHVDML